ncbi:hypothetical protein, partial [Salmonella sp. s54925]|uniref:hypothetical protein n=1 Tax=Salmonella sp. s54925 TaxID=3159674 RepID=UPI0039801A3E
RSDFLYCLTSSELELITTLLISNKFASREKYRQAKNYRRIYWRGVRNLPSIRQHTPPRENQLPRKKDASPSDSLPQATAPPLGLDTTEFRPWFTYAPPGKSAPPCQMRLDLPLQFISVYHFDISQ